MFGHNASRGSSGGTPAYDYLINQSVFNCLHRIEEHIALGVLFDLSELLTGVPHNDVVQRFARPQNLPRLNLDIGRLPLCAAKRLMNHYTRMWQSITPSLGASQKQHSRHARRLTQTQSRYRRPDELHRIVDGESSRNRSSRRIDVEADLFFGILRLEKEQLRGYQVGHIVVHRMAQKNDPVLEQPRVDVVSP